MYTGRKGPLVIWNLENLDPRSPMYAFSETSDVDYFLRSFREFDLLWKKDFDLYILVPPSQAKLIQKTIDSYKFEGNHHLTVHAIEDPFNLKLTDFTKDMTEQWNRPIFYMGQCT